MPTSFWMVARIKGEKPRYVAFLVPERSAGIRPTTQTASASALARYSAVLQQE